MKHKKKEEMSLFNKTKKAFSLLVVMAMVLSMFAGIAAAATNSVFSSGYTNVTTGDNKVGGTLTVSEKENNSWLAADTHYITVTLPDGVKFNTKPTALDADYVLLAAGAGTLAFDASSDSMLRVKLTLTGDAAADAVQFKFNVAGKSALDIASGFTGDVKAEVEVIATNGGAVKWAESDSRTIARVAAKSVEVKAAAPSVIQMGSAKTGAKITIEEKVVGSLLGTGVGTEEIRLEIVTSGVTFNAAPTFSPAGDVDVVGLGMSGDSKVYSFKYDAAASIFTRKLEITPVLNVDPTVTGNIQIKVRSTHADTAITETTVVVATFGTTAVEIVEVKNNTDTVYAGHTAKILEPTSGNKTSFNLKATTGNQIPADKIVVLELEGATFDATTPFVLEGRDGTGAWGARVATLNLYSDDTKVWFETSGAWAATTELRIKDIKVEAAGDAAAGDIKVKVSGSLGASGTVELGKVAKPFTVAADMTRLAYPGAAQAGADITITEAAKATILVDTLLVGLPTGVTFNGTPTVKVTTGDMVIGAVSINADGKLEIPVTSVSTTPSTITISKIKYDVARAAIEGDANVSVSAKAPVANWLDTKTIVSALVGRVGTVATKTVFTVGSASYTLDGATLTMDVAPVIKNGRTLLPLRFAAEAVGVDTDNIIWDSVRRTVTLIRGDRVVQVQIGSTTMLINGVAITMDVAPEIIDGRTMLPIRAIGTALNASITWDEVAKTVTITAN